MPFYLGNSGAMAGWRKDRSSFRDATRYRVGNSQRRSFFVAVSTDHDVRRGTSVRELVDRDATAFARSSKSGARTLGVAQSCGDIAASYAAHLERDPSIYVGRWRNGRGLSASRI